MRGPLVSVVIPAYRAAPYLAQLCVSLQGQTHENLEVLLLNDGSPDEPEPVIRPFLADDRFRWISWPRNLGVNRATTMLLSMVAGEFWCNPGADDVLLPQFVEKRVRLLQENPSAFMVHGAAQYIDENGAPTTFGTARPDLPPCLEAAEALRVLLQHNVISTPSVMVRSRVTRLVLPFFQTDWRFAQDWACWLLHAASGFDLLWDPECLHSYRIHPQSLTQEAARVATRLAEVRLVPLCTLSVAAQFSPWAGAVWEEHGASLYALWLRRAWRLRQDGRLQPHWLSRGASAFYGPRPAPVGLNRELARHAWRILRASWRERRIGARLRIPVSGLVEVDHPLFR